MRTAKGIWIGIAMAALVLFAAQQADAARASATGGGTIFDSYVYKQAKGTKMFGPLTIYYDVTDVASADCDDSIKADMHVFLRLRKGSDLYAFSDVFSGVCYQETEAQILLFDGFIRTVVVPPLFGNNIPPGAINVKSVEEVVDCPDPNICFQDDGAYFTILDIEIAVQP